MSNPLQRHTYVQEPLNRGAAPDQLRYAPITPVENFFVRSHGPTPQIDLERHRVTVDGCVRLPLSFSPAELREHFPTHTVTATLQCAGQRRREMTEWKAIDANEIIWGVDAISTATWTGVRLRDVIQMAEPTLDAAHVALLGLDSTKEEPRGFGGSIPLAKALEPDALLAFEINGVPLPLEHGFPLRTLIPGYIGARSVKWLTRISLQPEPSSNYYQAHAYKLFPPTVRAATVNWAEGEMLGALPINSFITSPQPGAHVAQTPIKVEGIALPGGDALIERVELSCDGGQTWCAAQLVGPRQQWTWSFWESECDLPPGSHELVVRAFDSAGNAQPEQMADVWNFKGYVNNAYQRVVVERV